jgi:hypothetical protein
MFRGFDIGALGVLYETSVRLYRAPLRCEKFELGTTTRLPRIGIISTHARSYGLLVRAALQPGNVDGSNRGHGTWLRQVVYV